MFQLAKKKHNLPELIYQAYNFLIRPILITLSIYRAILIFPSTYVHLILGHLKLVLMLSIFRPLRKCFFSRINNTLVFWGATSAWSSQPFFLTKTVKLVISEPLVVQKMTKKCSSSLNFPVQITLSPLNTFLMFGLGVLRECTQLEDPQAPVLSSAFLHWEHTWWWKESDSSSRRPLGFMQPLNCEWASAERADLNFFRCDRISL